MPTFNPVELKGKLIFPKKDLVGYWGYPNSNNVQVLPAGKPIGRVFTIIPPNTTVKPGWNKNFFSFKQDGQYYYRGSQYEGKAGGVFYVPADIDAFDANKLIEQGAKDIKKQAEEKAEDDKSFFEKAGEKAETAIKWVAVGAAVYFGVKLFIDYQTKKK